MQNRKLQIFLSSTYEDLIDHRLAAMEAILAAGHIPAAMEQFSAGDDTALERIKTWIDESDAFILILGGRYGSIEPNSNKSYVQLEYEYAIERKKPFFALVVSDKHHEQRVKIDGLRVDEREHPEHYKALKALVTERLCRFWDDKKDIQNAILHKLPEWAQRDDLIGWVRGNQGADPEVANEIARLSQENRDLRTRNQVATTYAGVSFEDLCNLLSQEQVVLEDPRLMGGILETPLPEELTLLDLFRLVAARGRVLPARVRSPGDASYLLRLKDYGLLHGQGDLHLSDEGRAFRNRLLVKDLPKSL